MHVRVDFGRSGPDLKQRESYERSRSHMKLRGAFGRGCRDPRKAKQTVRHSASDLTRAVSAQGAVKKRIGLTLISACLHMCYFTTPL